MKVIEYYEVVEEQLGKILEEAKLESLGHWMKNKKSGKMRVSEQIAYYLGQLNLIQQMVIDMEEEE